MYSCSFTGHRLIARDKMDALCDLLDRAIEYAYRRGCRVFNNGGAIGFDICAAQRVLAFRESHPDVKLNMVLPCRNQSERWRTEQIAAYERVLSSADSVEYLSDVYYNGCMAKRNQSLVNRCDMLIAYVGSDTGGSAQTLRMAQKAEKEIYNLFPHLT